MAAASDFFKQLSAGVHFDRKRPEARIARAQSQPGSKSESCSQAHVIDFFNETVRPSDLSGKDRNVSSVSRPRSEHCDEELEDDAAIGNISVFRKAMRINAKGEDVADPVGRFADLQVFEAHFAIVCCIFY